jgi:hypothetical protein
MRLGIQLLDTGATLNRFQTKTQIQIAQGETTTIFFQLLDKDQKGLRYVPATGATVLVEIPRFSEAFATASNQRQQIDYSVRRAATAAFPSDDRSIWKLPLTATDTANMMSSNIRVTVTEGSEVKIATLSMAIEIVRSEA